MTVHDLRFYGMKIDFQPWPPGGPRGGFEFQLRVGGKEVGQTFFCASVSKVAISLHSAFPVVPVAAAGRLLLGWWWW